MKKYILSITLSLFAFVFVSATYLRGDDLKDVFLKINQEVLQNSRAYETLNEACATIGHRLTGSLNGRRAEEFAYNLFKKYGYATDAKYQPFEVESWMRDTVTLVVVPNKSDNYRDVPVVALAHSPVDAKIKGDIVDVGNGLEEDFETVKSKIILLYQSKILCIEDKKERMVLNKDNLNKRLDIRQRRCICC